MAAIGVNVLERWSPLVNKVHYLIKSGGKKVQRGQNPTIRAQVVPAPGEISSGCCVLFHDFFVVQGIFDVNISFKLHSVDGRVQVNQV